MFRQNPWVVFTAVAMIGVGVYGSVANWKFEGSESRIAPIMRRLESRIGPLRTEAVQQLPPLGSHLT